MRHIIRVILGLSVLLSHVGNAECSRHCNPETSKACGHGCISKYFNCHKPTTTACNDGTESNTKKVYNTPTHVEPGSDQPKAKQ